MGCGEVCLGHPDPDAGDRAAFSEPDVTVSAGCDSDRLSVGPREGELPKGAAGAHPGDGVSAGVGDPNVSVRTHGHAPWTAPLRKSEQRECTIGAHPSNLALGR